MNEREQRLLLDIHQLLADSRLNGQHGPAVNAIELMMRMPRFQQFLKANPGKAPVEYRTDQDLQVITFLFLMMWLTARDYEAAATLCWDTAVFTGEPRAVRMTWEAVRKHRLLNILGGASMGKTYSPSAWMLLDWCLDPDWTLVRVMSTKEDHVKKNMFADIQRLHSGSVVTLPGRADAESIATETGKRGGQGIFILVIPRGSDAGGTIKGSKVKPRPNHPLFGTSSRTRLLIDEAQEVPENAFDEIPNLYSSMEEGDTEHTKIVMSANPKDEFSRYGRNCVPVKGWDGIRTRDSDIDEWESERGWHCLRLNAMKSENVLLGRTKYQRFFTAEGYRLKLRDAGGDADHPLIWSEVYGMFPTGSSMTTIVQKHWVDRSYGDWLFDSPTIPVAGEDVAITGDLPTQSAGRVGRAVGWVDRQGARHMLPTPRWVLQADVVGVLPRGDSQELADHSMQRLKPLGVRPQHFAIDRTGVGQGTHDIIRHQWREKVDGQRGATDTVSILGVHYAESPTEQRIAEEDTQTPKQRFVNVATELWYATAKFFEYDCIRIGKGVDYQTIDELVNRRGGSPAGKGKLLTVESKDDFKSRNTGRSCDRADAFTLMVQAARLGVAELRPRAPDTQLPARTQRSLFDPEPEHGMTIREPIVMDGGMFTTKPLDTMRD